MARKPDKERSDRYLQLHHYMLKTEAWKALSAAAVRVYIQIGSRYNGANNGKLAFSVRDAAGECNLDKGTASRAFKELIDRGFIEETRHGGLNKKTRIASEWRLTAFKCDLTGALKTCAFMHRGGSEYSSHTPQKRGPLPGASRPSPVRINSRECPKKLPTLSETTPDEAPQCPKQLPIKAGFGPPPVRNNYPHLIYQSPTTDSTAQGTPARPTDTAVAAPAFDLIQGAFRIGDRRIELRKPVAAALSLTAGQLAQHVVGAPTPARSPEK